ncbi:hypothetical protein J6590_007664 [Homalodisca vitripennis]|nr:hypothetical protein J6590_007664 [Homalodisca vitripennis]
MGVFDEDILSEPSSFHHIQIYDVKANASGAEEHVPEPTYDEVVTVGARNQCSKKVNESKKNRGNVNGTVDIHTQQEKNNQENSAFESFWKTGSFDAQNALRSPVGSSTVLECRSVWLPICLVVASISQRFIAVHDRVVGSEATRTHLEKTCSHQSSPMVAVALQPSLYNPCSTLSPLLCIRDITKRCKLNQTDSSDHSHFLAGTDGEKQRYGNTASTVIGLSGCGLL